jgi:hypothetical protein
MKAEPVVLVRMRFMLRGIQHLSIDAWLLGIAFPDNRYTRGVHRMFLSYCSDATSNYRTVPVDKVRPVSRRSNPAHVPF